MAINAKPQTQKQSNLRRIWKNPALELSQSLSDFPCFFQAIHVFVILDIMGMERSDSATRSASKSQSTQTGSSQTSTTQPVGASNLTDLMEASSIHLHQTQTVTVEQHCQLSM